MDGPATRPLEPSSCKPWQADVREVGVVDQEQHAGVSTPVRAKRPHGHFTGGQHEEQATSTEQESASDGPADPTRDIEWHLFEGGLPGEAELIFADPVLVHQMHILCDRIGFLTGSQPEALLDHLVTWGHKVLDHQDHFQQQLDVLKQDMLSPCPPPGPGASVAPAAADASAAPKATADTARSSSDAADAGAAAVVTPRPTAAAPLSPSMPAMGASTGSSSDACANPPMRSSGINGSMRDSNMDAELQQWLQQLDELWQLAGGAAGAAAAAVATAPRISTSRCSDGSNRTTASSRSTTPSANSSSRSQEVPCEMTAGIRQLLMGCSPAAAAAAASGARGDSRGRVSPSYPAGMTQLPSAAAAAAEGSERGVGLGSLLQRRQATADAAGMHPLVLLRSSMEAEAAAAAGAAVTPTAVTPPPRGSSGVSDCYRGRASSDGLQQGFAASHYVSPPAGAAKANGAGVAASSAQAKRNTPPAPHTPVQVDGLPEQRPRSRSRIAAAAAAAAATTAATADTTLPTAAAAGVTSGAADGAKLQTSRSNSSSSHTAGSWCGSSSAASANTSSSCTPDQLSPTAGLPAACPARALFPVAAPAPHGAAAGDAALLPMPYMAVSPSSCVLPSINAAAAASGLQLPAAAAAAAGTECHVAAAGLKVIPQLSSSSSSSGSDAKAVPFDLPTPGASPSERQAASCQSSRSNKEGLGLLLEPWQRPQHQVQLPQPAFVANAGAAWMPSDRAAAARTAVLTAHIRRTTSSASPTPAATSNDGTAAAVDVGQLALKAGIMGVSPIRLQKAPSSPAAAQAMLAGEDRAADAAGPRSSGSSPSSTPKQRSAMSARSGGEDFVYSSLAAVPEVEEQAAEPQRRRRGLVRGVARKFVQLLRALRQRVTARTRLVRWLQRQACALASGAMPQGVPGLVAWLALAGAMGCSMGVLAAVVAGSAGAHQQQQLQTLPQQRKRAARRALLQQLRRDPDAMLTHWQLYEAGMVAAPPGADGSSSSSSSMKLVPRPKRSSSSRAAADGAAQAAEALTAVLVPRSAPSSSAAAGGSGAQHPSVARLTGALGGTAGAAAAAAGGWVGEVTGEVKQRLGPALARLASTKDIPAAAAAAAGAGEAESSASAAAGKPSSRQDGKQQKQQQMYWYVEGAASLKQQRKRGGAGKGAGAAREQRTPVVTHVTPQVQQLLQPALHRLALTAAAAAAAAAPNAAA